MTPLDDAASSPWHSGEREAQRRAGVEERMASVGRRTIRDFMPDQHRDFFATLPFVVVGSVDAGGRPWASILTGRPGFMSSPHPHLLRIAASPAPGDVLAAALRPGVPLGLLGIELATRRRNRMNGPVSAVGDGGFAVAVAQSFGNCPQYIHRREEVASAASGDMRAEALAALDPAARGLIESADTFFVASSAAVAGGGVDVSHRGGRSGFVGIDGSGALVIPDYRGNHYFNTLGNLMVNPVAGLVFIDFVHGDLLQVTGTAEILWQGAERDAFRGAERLWRLHPTRACRQYGAFPLRFADRDPAPTVAATGTWREAEAALAAAAGD